MDTCERRYVASNVFTRKPRQRETNVLISQRFITASIIFYHVLDTVYLHYYTTQLARFWLLDATCDGKREREREKKREGKREGGKERERERAHTHERRLTSSHLQRTQPSSSSLSTSGSFRILLGTCPAIAPRGLWLHARKPLCKPLASCCYLPFLC